MKTKNDNTSNKVTSLNVRHDITMKSRYKIGDVVEVNKDIYRVEVNKDLYRVEGLYAKAGERGTIIEIFRPIGTGAGEKKALCAKVKMNDSQAIKTFRLTSLMLIT